MSGRFLLDTNIVIALFAQDAGVLRNLMRVEAIFVPSIVIGELYFGSYNSSRPAENIRRVDRFRDTNTVFEVDSYTASFYGQIKYDLKRAGTPLPENDIWIAALALQYQLILVSRDSHFNRIGSVVIEPWQE